MFAKGLRQQTWRLNVVNGSLPQQNASLLSIVRFRSNRSNRFEEDALGMNEFGEVSSDSMVYSSVVRDISNNEVRRASFSNKAKKIFVPEGKTLEEDLKGPDNKRIIKNDGGSRFRSGRQMKINEPLYGKSYWEELQDEETVRHTKFKAIKEKQKLREKAQRAESRRHEDDNAKGAFIGEDRAKGEDRGNRTDDPFLSIGEKAPYRLNPVRAFATNEDFKLKPSNSSQSETDSGGQSKKSQVHNIDSEDFFKPSNYINEKQKAVSERTIQTVIDPLDTEASSSGTVPPEDLTGESLFDDIERKHITPQQPLQDSSSSPRNLTNVNVLEFHSPDALKSAKAGIPAELWEDSRPERAFAMKEILKSQTTGGVLTAVGSHVEKMDGLGCAAAVHRLGKYITLATRQSVLHDKRFADLMSAVEGMVETMEPRSLVSVFWGLVKLDHAPTFLPTLLNKCTENVDNFDVSNVTTALFCLSKFPFATKEATLLRDKLIERLYLPSSRESFFSDPHQTTCLLSALAQLQVKEPELVSTISKHVEANLENYDISHLSSVSWALAQLNLTDVKMMNALKGIVEQRADNASPKELVKLAWSLAKMGQSDTELFSFSLAPLIRSYLLSYDAKELSSILWAFSTAGVDDHDFFGDVAAAMIGKAKGLHAQELATVSLAFARSGYYNSELLATLSQHALRLSASMTSAQLSKCIYGFGMSGLSDAKVYGQLAASLETRREQWRLPHVLHALHGLSEAECLNLPIIKPMLELVERNSGKVFMEDAISVLHLLSKLPPPERSHKLIEGLIDIIKSRERKWRNLDPSGAADLLEALHDLKWSDSDLLQTILGHSHMLLKNASRAEFLRLLGAFAYLNDEDRQLLRTHLIRREEIQKHISEHLQAISEMTSADLQSRVVLLYATTRIGYEDESTRRMLDEVRTKLDSLTEAIDNKESTPFYPPPPSMVAYWLWTATQLGFEPSWTQNATKAFLRRRYDSPEAVKASDEERVKMGVPPQYEGHFLCQGASDPFSDVNGLPRGAVDAAEALLKICWTSVSQGMVAPNDIHAQKLLADALNECSRAFDGSIPKDLLSAQQIALEVFHQKQLKGLNEETKLWMEDVLACPRQDIFAWGDRGGAKHARAMGKVLASKVKDYNYDEWLSAALVELKIPHKRAQTVCNGVYRVPIAFPNQHQVIDVLGMRDFMTPTNRPTAVAELRQRQLSFSGLTVHSVHLKTLYDAMRDGAMRSFLVGIIRGFTPEVGKYADINNRPAGSLSLEKGVSGKTKNVDALRRQVNNEPKKYIQVVKDRRRLEEHEEFLNDDRTNK